MVVQSFGGDGHNHAVNLNTPTLHAKLGEREWLTMQQFEYSDGTKTSHGNKVKKKRENCAIYSFRFNSRLAIRDYHSYALDFHSV